MKKQTIKPQTTKKSQQTVEQKQEQKTVVQLQTELMKMRMELLAGKLKDVRKISKTRDDIARRKTVERAKELAQV